MLRTLKWRENNYSAVQLTEQNSFSWGLVVRLSVAAVVAGRRIVVGLIGGLIVGCPDILELLGLGFDYSAVQSRDRIGSLRDRRRVS